MAACRYQELVVGQILKPLLNQAQGNGCLSAPGTPWEKIPLALLHQRGGMKAEESPTLQHLHKRCHEQIGKDEAPSFQQPFREMAPCLASFDISFHEGSILRVE